MNRSESTKVHVFPSPRGVAQFAAVTLEEVAASRSNERIAIALSGGSTPSLVYEVLVEGYREDIPWERLEIFFVDERSVPADHADSNYGLARRLLLSHVPVPADQVHRMPADAKDLHAAAHDYEEALRRVVAGGSGGAGDAGGSGGAGGTRGVPVFDLIWLGMGDDGHTASLFPGTRALAESERLVVANEVPQLKTWRMTFTYPLLNHARRVQFIVTGEKKAPMIDKIFARKGAKKSADAPPAARVEPVEGLLEWVLDRRAAAELEDPDLLA